MEMGDSNERREKVSKGLFCDHFSTVSAGYAAFRPAYPELLFAWLASVTPLHRLAWDCATGSGQAAVALAAHFERVVATDASSSQILAARAHPRIDYRVALADSSGLDDNSVDLVTVAQALHWFDIKRFFEESRRVLVPGGLLAVWSYGRLVVEGAEVDALVQEFYHGVVGPFWPAERALVDSGYRDIVLPFQPLQAPLFEMTAFWSLSELLGYIRTWSATARYIEANGIDPVEQLGEQLSACWGRGERLRKVSWPLVVRAGHT